MGVKEEAGRGGLKISFRKRHAIRTRKERIIIMMIIIIMFIIILYDKEKK